MELTAIIGAVVSLAGAAVTAILTRTAFSLQTRRELRELYAKLMAFRSEHPEVLYQAREFTPEMWTMMYGSNECLQTKWALYYTYLEHCLIYCNHVLAARGLVRRHYRHQSEPLVRLLITENWPAVADLLKDEYVSQHVRTYVANLKATGRDWDEEHRLLALPVGTPDRHAENSIADS